MLLELLHPYYMHNLLFSPGGVGTVTSAERDKFFETRERLIRVLEHDITQFRWAGT